MRERPSVSKRDRNEQNGQGNRYLTPLNNLCEGIHEQDMSRSPLPLRLRGIEEREISLRDQDEEEEPLHERKKRFHTSIKNHRPLLQFL